MVSGESSSSEAPQEHWFPRQRNDDVQEKEVLKWTKDAGENEMKRRKVVEPDTQDDGYSLPTPTGCEPTSSQE